MRPGWIISGDDLDEVVGNEARVSILWLIADTTMEATKIWTGCTALFDVFNISGTDKNHFKIKIVLMGW